MESNVCPVLALGSNIHLSTLWRGLCVYDVDTRSHAQYLILKVRGRGNHVRSKEVDREIFWEEGVERDRAQSWSEEPTSWHSGYTWKAGKMAW